MRMFSKKGSAALEMMAFMPFISLFALATVQFFEVGAEAINNLISANSTIQSSIYDWMSPTSLHENLWPCLEDMPLGGGGRVRVSAYPIRIGMTEMGFDIHVPQEVVFVTEPICSD